MAKQSAIQKNLNRKILIDRLSEKRKKLKKLWELEHIRERRQQAKQNRWVRDNQKIKDLRKTSDWLKDLSGCSLLCWVFARYVHSTVQRLLDEKRMSTMPKNRDLCMSRLIFQSKVLPLPSWQCGT